MGPHGCERRSTGEPMHGALLKPMSACRWVWISMAYLVLYAPSPHLHTP